MTEVTVRRDAAPRLALAVIGAGPVGLALALRAAETLPGAEVSLFDARPAEADISGDPRTLALSEGSVQALGRLGAWDAERAQPILEVHVSQQAPSLAALLPGGRGDPALSIRAVDEGVAELGAVLPYGAIVAPLQTAWTAAVAAEPRRLFARFGAPVRSLREVRDGAGGVEIEIGNGLVERVDLAVVAEGGVFQSEANRAAPGLVPGLSRTREREAPPLRHDYRQTAWVGTATFDPATPIGATAYERFTRHGPAALLPLPDGRAGLVWCVPSDDDPVAGLDDAQRAAVLRSVFHARTPRIATVSPMKRFPLGLVAERSLVSGRTVRIGNAAQTLHPVAGQGLNLGLRDAEVLVRALLDAGSAAGIDRALRRVERERMADRWSMIATTDFLARSFTWKLPGAAAARGLGIAALDALAPVKSRIARRMMFGTR